MDCSVVESGYRASKEKLPKEWIVLTQLISKQHLIYSLAPQHEPVAHVQSGEELVFETCDCFQDQITSEDTPFDGVNWKTTNPATGPVFVNGAQPGDTLAVTIHRIEVTSQGCMVTGPKLGVIGDQLKENVIRVIPIEDSHAIMYNQIKIPLNPMIGVIGTAPAKEDISCGTPGEHGGNMDCKLITAGTTLYLPVHVPGALFALGDLHAVMGDGEVSVCGVEVAGMVTVTLDVMKGQPWKLPMLKTDHALYTLASELLLDDAAASATRNMVHYLEVEYGLSKEMAISLLSIAGNLQICQVVDPLKTARFEMPHSLLEQIRLL